jgi:4-amino-4-deoxy-L-arabinose transferase-like glycosyltransferase
MAAPDNRTTLADAAFADVASSTGQQKDAAARRRTVRIVAAVLAVLFFLWCMLTADLTHIMEPDEARHAMNGALLYDMVRTGGWRHPIDFAKTYYAHFPAISMPYHPPVFPIFEAIIYAGLGVSTFTARLAAAICAGVSIWLLFLLVVRLYGSVCVALAVVLTFCSLPVSTLVAREVMLEFPTFVFVFASLYFSDLDRWTRLRPALWFALFGALAVWSKQAVFLGLVPWFLLIVERRWALLKRLSIWAFSAVFGAACLGFAAWSALAAYSGTNPGMEVSTNVWRHCLFYLRAIAGQLGLTGLLVAAAGTLTACVAPHGRDRRARNLCAVWAVAAFLVPVFVGQFDARYIIFMYPALLVLSYAGIYRISERLFSPRVAGVLTLAASLAFFATNMRTDRIYVTGISDAAALVAADRARAVYFGAYNGEFIHAVRVLDPSLASVVIRADQFEPELSRPDELLAFTRAYGIRFFVVRTPESETAKEARSLFGEHSGMFTEVRRIRLTSSAPSHRGTLHVYRFTGPAPAVTENITIRSRTLGKSLNLKF